MAGVFPSYQTKYTPLRRGEQALSAATAIADGVAK